MFSKSNKSLVHLISIIVWHIFMYRPGLKCIYLFLFFFCAIVHLFTFNCFVAFSISFYVILFIMEYFLNFNIYSSVFLLQLQRVMNSDSVLTEDLIVDNIILLDTSYSTNVIGSLPEVSYFILNF